MMPSREQLIKILNSCIFDDHPLCDQCYTGGPGFGIECRQMVIEDAKAMLINPEEVEQDADD